MFLTAEVASQVGTMALVPQVVDAVNVPVIAAGGIGDARGIAAAIALGADGVQMGTAFLRCPEATTTEVHREALRNATNDQTALTNVLTGRPAHSVVNPASSRSWAPCPTPRPFCFPRARLRRFGPRPKQSDRATSPLWSGPAGELTRLLAAEADHRLHSLAAPDMGETGG
jgi:nitronate monooxygenase